ncbi:MAG: hypothetical protein A3G59_02430 [Candidatus Taylorbacteria bacterium RIFCSPLOWO2_12_FULL_47_20]|uniref:Uncharacterized protein n=2 Tax=Candidatus Tayloriibacteriota TaxID=1817919 RepID=A0A1G2P842_9BACT|nr:MAG: hypothetical protein A3H68_00260 [Candidatus Taylorbacteria bacterium RIFCSPLOWO2_02_FULL_46_40]OHA44535.1 MAG: hypothetical protein A3G59_02430 [Candidatus Taylorbacteria bacterium RIFCSPLOWO2_12_FULL_47_20]
MRNGDLLFSWKRGVLSCYSFENLMPLSAYGNRGTKVDSSEMGPAQTEARRFCLRNLNSSTRPGTFASRQICFLRPLLSAHHHRFFVCGNRGREDDSSGKDPARMEVP